MTPAQTEAYVDAAAAMLDLPLQPDHRPGVLHFFALAAEFAAVVEAVPLDAHAESAVAFEPVELIASTTALPASQPVSTRSGDAA